MKGPSHDANKRRLALITFLLSNQLAFGLVNLAAITITPPATRTPSTSPWIAARRRRARTPLFNAPTDAATAVEGSSSSSTTTSPDESPPLSLSASSSSQRDDAVVQQQSPPNQKVGTTNSNNNGVVVLPRKGVWMPPSQNVAQRRGKIFSIEQPQDLLDFVIEDERLSVVKVYASWCKTCKVFDVRYRKLASQYGDEYDDTDKSGTTQRVERKGRVRFAEMQYDNPNNEEMCKLLNATKLPYILMYKGSKGKVKEFQCGPAKVQLLIDAVNELADPVVEESDVGTNGDEVSESSKPFDGGDLAASHYLNDNNLTKTSYGEDNTIKDLRQKLIALENEKVEMFEIMKAQIEHDKEYIQKLESGVETQKYMIETKDGEISGLKTSIEKERSTIKSLESGVETQTSMLETKDGEISSLKNSIEQEQSMAKSQREKIEQAEEELASFQSQVSELTDRLSQIEETATSLDLELSLNKKAAEKKEKGFLQQREEWEGHKEMYEKDRNSLRRLAVLGVKRVGRGARSLFFGVRRK